MTQAQDEPAGPAQWHAYWVWGAENRDGGDGYFRLPFALDELPKTAVVQGSGDDGYELFINGVSVRSSGFWWERTDRTDILGHLRVGKNVLAACCHNAGFPGGWLAELSLAFPDGTERQVITDRATRFSTEGPEGWNQPGFDDSGCETVEEIARPPGGAWGELPIEYIGARDHVKLQLHAPEAAAAGDDISLSAEATLVGDSPHNSLVYVELVRGEAILERIDLAPDPPTDRWKAGESHDIGPVTIHLSRYASSGTYRARVGLYRGTTAEGSRSEAEIEVAGREGTLKWVGRQVHRPLGAMPTLGNDRELPLIFTQGRDPGGEAVRQMAEAGVRIYSFGCSMGWVGPGKYDYSLVDEQMLAALRADEQGMLLPRVEVGAPAWWLDANEGELTRYADGVGWESDVFGGTRHVSFASEKWKSEAGEALAKLLQHIGETTYKDRLAGVHVATGIYGEWHYWSPSHLPDVSEPMRQRLIRHVRSRYASLAELNEAWGTTYRSLRDVTCPTQEERLAHGDVGIFRDIGKSRRLLDYYDCMHSATADAITSFCSVAKRETDRKALTGAFYSYITDLGWASEGGHLAPEIVLNHPDVDFLTSPHSYSRRAPGQDGGYRNYPASAELHGKLFIDENDDRTYLSPDDGHRHAATKAKTLEVMWRGTANALTHNVGQWWFDMTGGWYDDPDLLDVVAKTVQLEEMTRRDPRARYSEVAVICDPRTFETLEGWQTGRDTMSQTLFIQQIGELHKMGAPFDVYLASDLEYLLESRPEYKCYVLLNTWYMPAAKRHRLAQALRERGGTTLFMYAPGFSSDEGLSAEHISELTGIGVETIADGMALRADSEWGEFGDEARIVPGFRVAEAGLTVLATDADTNEPRVVAKQDGEWTGVYATTAPLPAEMLREIAREAGVHIYLETPDILYLGGQFIGVHATEAGTKRVTLPGMRAAIDCRGGEAKYGRSFEVEMKQGETALYYLTSL